MLLDQPVIRRSTLEEMARVWQAQRPALVIPTHRGQRGHPLLIAARCVGSILSLPTDRTLREFVNQYRSETKLVEVDDPGVLSDIDTPHDYQRVLEQLRTAEIT
jgi:molybdenum cofactor cytidylyltransferase